MRRPLTAAGLALALCHCHGANQAPGARPASAPAIPDRNLFAYLLDDAGGLTPLAGSPFPSGGQLDDVESLSALPSRHLLFAASSASNSFSVLRFDTQRGELVPLPGSPYRAEGLAPSETAVSGDFLFVGNAASNTVSSFRLRDDGVPLQIEGSPAATGGDLLEGMTVDPLGRFVLVANANSSTISVLRIAPDGTLFLAPGSPFAGVFLPDEIVVDRTGSLVFVTNRAQATISVFKLGADGRLIPAPGSPYPAPAGFASFEHCLVDRSGTLLLATFESPPAILTYRIGPDGALTVAQAPVLLGTATAGGPEGMALDPKGRFVYLTDHIADRVHVFAIDSSGVLTDVIPGGARIAAEPFDVIIPGWDFGGRQVMFVSSALR
jgi:DNA-binding beta-propeller fold protein YncE